MATFKMSAIFFMEQVRTPFSLVWTIMSPTVLFFFLHFNEIELHTGDTSWLRGQVSWFLGYISFSVVLFNYCLYLTGRRESGFIATFVHDMSGRLLFIRSQLIASLTMSVVYVCFFVGVVFAGFQAEPDYLTVLMVIKTLSINALMMTSMTFLSSLRITFQTASTIYSVLITVCMVFGIVSLKYDHGFISWFNKINPIIVYSTLIDAQKSLSLLTIIFYGILCMLSLIAAMTFRIEPVWSSQ